MVQWMLLLVLSVLRNAMAKPDQFLYMLLFLFKLIYQLKLVFLLKSIYQLKFVFLLKSIYQLKFIFPLKINDKSGYSTI